MLGIPNPADYATLSAEALLQEEGELLLEQATIQQKLAHVKAWKIRHTLLTLWPDRVHLHYAYEFDHDSGCYWVYFSENGLIKDGISFDDVQNMDVLVNVLDVDAEAARRRSHGEGRGVIRLKEDS